MLEEVAFDQPVDQPDVIGLLRPDGGSRSDHLERLFDPGDAGQALSPAGAGKQPEFDLGNAQFRRRHRHPVMTAEGNLEPAAKRGAMDRGDHRLGAGLDPVDHLGQPRHDRGLAEFGDVGAREEGLPLADDHHGCDVGGGLGLLDPGDQALPDRSAERVHRGIVRADDEDVAVDFGADGRSHDSLLLDGRAAIILAIERVARRQAAVDHQSVAVDIARFVGCEE